MAMEQRLLFYPNLKNPSEDEIEVATILLRLPDMIYRLESPLLPISLPPSWGCQRKRSALAVKNDYASTMLRPVQLGLPSYYSSLLMRCPVADDGSTLATAALPLPPPANAIKVETSSPDTPLSFEPSESEDNHPHQLRKKVLGKREREEWYKIVEELTKEKEPLEIELRKVEHHCAKLNDFNLHLKARKDELMRLGQKRARLGIEPTSNNNIPVLPSSQSRVIAAPTPAANQEHYLHHQPFPISCVMPYRHQLQLNMDQRAQNQRSEIYDDLGYPTSLPSSTIGGLRMISCTNSNVGAARGLNLCFKDAVVVNCSQPYDRVKAAEARQKRLEYCRARRPRFHSR